MTDHPPVTDWATDFDHTDDAWAADPYPIWAELREPCPVAHSERFGGVWLPTRHEDIAAIAYDTERFTSRSVIVGERRPPLELAPEGIAPPISADPPFHAESRRMLLPTFSPKQAEALEPSTRAYCQELLAAVAGQDVVDGAVEYAQHIPVRVISDMLGLPESDADVFRGFVHHMLEGVTLPIEERIDGILELFTYLSGHIADHREHPRDDLISFLIDAEMGGEKLDDFQIVRTIGLVLIAGIDTTWSAIGASLWHLAGHPEDRQRLVAEPELMPFAIEEFLRAYAPVTMARLVKQDMDFNGCPMKAEDYVLLPFPAANRDPEQFEDPDTFVIDRKVNRHAAFGLGVHRCAGANLARMEMTVAIEEWLKAFPVFELDDPDAVTWSHGQVRGPRILPLRIGG